MDEATYDRLRQDLEQAEKLVFFTDNCGEVLLDKLLLQEIGR